jgi:hypothetical protein
VLYEQGEQIGRIFDLLFTGKSLKITEVALFWLLYFTVKFIYVLCNFDNEWVGIPFCDFLNLVTLFMNSLVHFSVPNSTK